MNNGNGPRIPIPGAAGASIEAALRRVAMHSGDCAVVITVRKLRVPNGGYAYAISALPARPDDPQEH